MYQKIKQTIFHLIRDDDNNDLAASIFDGSIIFLILLNVIIYIIDSFARIPSHLHHIFITIEQCTVCIFLIEYLLRLWTSDLIRPTTPPWRARLAFICSPIAVIDLFAILPFLIPGLFPYNLLVLRLVRVLKLLHIFKATHYTDALTAVGNVIKKKMPQLVSSVMVVLVLMVIAALLMYTVEHDAQPTIFKNAFSGFWWAIETLTTVGYGDIYPVTILGKTLGMLIALLGIGLIAVPSGIISAGFMEGLDENRKQKGKHYCPYCGKYID